MTSDSTEIGKKEWLFAKLQPGRGELTQLSPRLLAKPCITIGIPGKCVMPIEVAAHT